MPLQNRVTPTGQIIAIPSRGTMMGNRGIIHDFSSKTLLTRRWQHKAWICCVLSYKDWQHPIMGKSAYTELFFTDEATALAAGHRPCALCRRSDFNTFKSAWISAHKLDPGYALRVAEIDATLHRERVDKQRRQITYSEDIDRLPAGVFVDIAGCPHLLTAKKVYSWSAHGYGDSQARPKKQRVTVLTPRTIVDVIIAGYTPHIHPAIAN